MAEEMGLIQGQQPGSVNEWNVYVALVRSGLKNDISYQYPIDGGREVRGGQVLDFVVWRPPAPVAIYVQGSYWHTGKRALEEILKQRAAEKRGFRVVEIWENESETIEAAVQAVREKVL